MDKYEETLKTIKKYGFEIVARSSSGNMLFARDKNGITLEVTNVYTTSSGTLSYMVPRSVVRMIIDDFSPVTNEKLFHRMYTQMIGVVEQINSNKQER